MPDPAAPVTAPRWAILLLKVAALSALLIFGLFIGLNFILGKGAQWATGGWKGGDLAQHYVAARVWVSEPAENLFQGFQLGERINDWYAANGDDSRPIARFNYVYSPFVVEIASWACSWDYNTWVNIWFIFSWACFLLAGWDFLRSHPRSGPLPVLIPLLYLGFPSFYYTLVPGQNTPLTLLIAAAAGLLLNRNMPWLAGFVFSCAFYKPQFMPVIAGIMLLAGQWRFAVALGIGNVLWLLLGIGVCGWDSHLLWLDSLKNMAEGKQFQQDGLNQSWRGTLLSLLPSHRGVADILSLGIAAVIGLATAWAGRLGWKRGLWPPSVILFLSLTAFLLGSPYVGHYELLLGLPWWIVFAACYRPGWRPGVLLAVYWLTALCAVAGLYLHMAITAPFITLWMAGSVALVLKRNKPMGR